MTWTIDESLQNERLDQALTAFDPAVSRAQWQKRIKESAVFINEKPVLIPHRRVEVGDVVTWDATKAIIKPEDVRVFATLPPLKIVAETPDWLVINKPAGLLVHPASDTKEATLVDSLLKFDPAIAKVGSEPERPGIIHRLDRDVSGLMIVARTQAAYDDLQTQFRERKIDKTYLALVHGVLEQDTGDIRFKIARSTTQGRMAARPEHAAEGKVAWTYYTVVERLPGASLLRVNIMSGRTHQIRAHLFALGHPVFGDVLYKNKHNDRRREAPRLMLQSIELSFLDPKTQEKQSFTLAADPAFAKLCDAWRLGNVTN